MQSNKQNLTIRGYKSSDKKNVQDICIMTSGEPFKGNPMMEQLLLVAFCNYYIDIEPSNCFVAANESDEAVGYILCAENSLVWNDRYNEEYVQKASDDRAKAFLTSICASNIENANEYPAHLHIDINPDYQHMGLGRRLMDALIDHLKSKKLHGVMFSVACENEQAINFYKKYGFEVIEEKEREIVMGMRL